MPEKRRPEGAEARERIDGYLTRSGLAARNPRVVPLTGDASDRRYYRVLLPDAPSIVLSLHAGPFEFERLPSPNPALVHDLATGRYIDERAPVLIVGPCGTGKSHLAQALGHCAVRQGHDVVFASCAQLLASLNAVLNTTAFVLMGLGYLAIKRGERERHRKLMLAAFTASCVFLASYLTRMALFGDTRFSGTGAIRTAYFVLLISHVLLALVAAPLVLTTLVLGLRDRIETHRKLALLLESGEADLVADLVEVMYQRIAAAKNE